jgi:hypothetical protein
MIITQKDISAVATLTLLGYTYHGGELWKPPLGKPRPSLPDVLTQEHGDSAQYVEGWNECREVMARMMK